MQSRSLQRCDAVGVYEMGYGETGGSSTTMVHGAGELDGITLGQTREIGSA